MKLMHKAGKYFSKAIILALITGVFFTYSACETDFDVNAPWKDITVVIGLLDQSEPIQYIKINKAFLGEGDANEMAQVRDSIEYENLNAIIEEWQPNATSPSRTYRLKDTILNNMEDGIFYSPDHKHKVYYFNEPNLNVDSKYKLIITFGGDGNKDTVRAETEIINDDELLVKMPPISTFFSFATGTNYINQDFEWQTAKDGKRYQSTIFFYYYDEVIENNDTILIPQTVEWSFPVKTSSDAGGGGKLKVIISGEEFYMHLKANIPPIDEDASINRRIPKTKIINNKFSVVIGFAISVAGEELNTYIEVNSPSTGIVQEKPEYTNVENGLGIFSCRYKMTGERLISSFSTNELVTGNIGGYTTNLGFCHPTNVNHANYCGN